MCGIAGLFIKDPNLQPQLGDLLSKMTSTLCGRGPDSAGFAVYGDGKDGKLKLVLAGPNKDFALEPVMHELARHLGADADVHMRHSHAVLSVDEGDVARARHWLAENAPEVNVVSQGERLEIFKEVGYPTDVAKSFGIAGMGGTHGISHTRMATESAVTTDGSHPFSTGADQCLVHNGSLSNHASLRRDLKRDGIEVRTQNDTEVAAAYLTKQMRDGKSLGKALESGLDDLDGFFTFVVGTENGFGVLRDPIACKPAVMAETDQYVAFASEFKSLTCLPGIEKAKVWEPKPATVYFWEHK
ncbi:glutamine amidotransferase [Methyloceanibacter superfactus]|jgi:methylamine---glutamate N-methyltransferase subunit A|uniref:Glutamine amidotransferase n=1 Tax=Methyloceanibacter superfactus TaxID=1774969 RepID=A0A1E3W5P2_9HYPH|nr:glutamine amidotransferase family protein [Methyloceanibacter superfactus]ODS00822.1 glutamine amidotransferase [Methyloceanibacter superfactus]